MTFSYRNDNKNESGLNTKTEKVFKTCKHSLAFTMIRTVCCSERVKENCDPAEKGCADNVIPVT